MAHFKDFLPFQTLSVQTEGNTFQGRVLNPTP